jgi:hypothetical protein
MSASQDLTVNWTNVPTRTITAGGVESPIVSSGQNPGSATPIVERRLSRPQRPGRRLPRMLI